MRRKDREITSTNDKLNIIRKCKVCRLGLSENNRPYIVPLNYGYDYKNNTLTLFFHSAKEGRKMDMIKNNHSACFEVDCDHQLIEGKKACNYSHAYKSVIGFGKIILIEDANEKIEALNRIMIHQLEKDINHDFSEEELEKVVIYKLVVEEFTGKQKVVEK